TPTNTEHGVITSSARVVENSWPPLEVLFHASASFFQVASETTQFRPDDFASERTSLATSKARSAVIPRDNSTTPLLAVKRSFSLPTGNSFSAIWARLC